MNPIINSLSFPMHAEINYIGIRTENDEIRRLTRTDGNTVLHPKSNWYVCMSFAYRNHGETENTIRDRVELFGPNTTLDDFIKRILDGPCYGFFRGLKPIFDESSIYKLEYVL